MLGVCSSRSSMKSSRKIMCSTRSSTETRSRSATVACRTSSRESMVATNQSCRKRLHHQFWKHVTAEDQLTVQWPEIAWNHLWFTKQQWLGLTTWTSCFPSMAIFNPTKKFDRVVFDHMLGNHFWIVSRASHNQQNNTLNCNFRQTLLYGNYFYCLKWMELITI